MFASQFKLDNLILFVDYNKQQLDGYTKNIMNMGDIGKKFESFGFFTQTVNGHNVDAIKEAIKKAKGTAGVPSCIVLDTIKGKGCILTEGIEANHHIAFKPEQMEEALKVAESVLANARAAL